MLRGIRIDANALNQRAAPRPIHSLADCRPHCFHLQFPCRGICLNADDAFMKFRRPRVRRYALAGKCKPICRKPRGGSRRVVQFPKR